MVMHSGKRGLLQPLIARPHLMIAALVGVALFFATAPWVARTTTRTLIAWDGGVLVFLALSFHIMVGASQEDVKRRAIAHDEGRHLMLIVTVLAAVASVAALLVELSDAKGHADSGIRVALAAVTVVLSWIFVQMVFALHYAHIYYLGETGGQVHGGLEFGDKDEPDYWDFLHFSLVMGATAQTADIIIRCKEIRRVGTLHTLMAFAFNTAILATMINLAANLF